MHPHYRKFIHYALGAPYSLLILTKRPNSELNLEDFATLNGFVFILFWYSMIKHVILLHWDARFALTLLGYITACLAIATVLMLWKSKIRSIGEKSPIAQEQIYLWFDFWVPAAMGFTFIFSLFGETPLTKIAFLGMWWMSSAVLFTLLSIAYRLIKKRVVTYFYFKYPAILRNKLIRGIVELWEKSVVVMLAFLCFNFFFHCLRLERGFA